jgi:GNAT superfamily N-acetyltransferase
MHLVERLSGGLVCVQGDLAALPRPRDLSPFRIREMDMRHPAEVAAWLEIHNEAFGHAWGRKEFTAHVLEHPRILILRTYFVMSGDRAIGAASAGVYRQKPEIGVGDYLGLRGNARGHGLGAALALHRYLALRDTGIRTAESQTYLCHGGALWIHFDCGFRPKLRRDVWNEPDPVSQVGRLVTRHRVNQLYARWSAARSVETTARTPAPLTA